MRLLSSMCIFLVLVIATGVMPAQETKDDLKALQGTWQAVDMEKDGGKAPLDSIQSIRWTFKGDQAMFGILYVMKIDPSKRFLFTVFYAEWCRRDRADSRRGWSERRRAADARLNLGRCLDLGRRPGQFTYRDRVWLVLHPQAFG